MFAKKGQSTLEYVLVLTAIIAAIVVVAMSVLRPRVNDSMTYVADQMNTAVHRINLEGPP